MKKETVTIASIINEGTKTKRDNSGTYTLFQIRLKDGRTGNGLGEEFLNVKEGQTLELNIKEGQYNGATTYTFYVPKPEQQSGNKFPQKNYTFEKRKVALEASVASYQVLGQSDGDAIIKRADKFFDFLNKQ